MDIVPPHFLQKLLSCGFGACNDTEHYGLAYNPDQCADAAFWEPCPGCQKGHFHGLVLLACVADAELLIVSCSLWSSLCLYPILVPSYDIDMGLSVVGALRCRRHH